jgi:hypothetical protein
MVPTHDGRPTRRVSDIVASRGGSHHRLSDHRATFHHPGAADRSFVRNFFYVVRRCA